MGSCVMNARCLKALSRILATLSKYDNHLTLLPTTDSLILTTVNQSRSAYLRCELLSLFFDSYQYTHTTPIKLNLKTLSNIFKHPENITKCHLSISSVNGLVIHLNCKYGVLKTHKLNHEETDPINAIYSKETPNSFIVAPKIIKGWMIHFNLKLDEVRFKCNPDHLVLKSFTDHGFINDTNDEIKRNLSTELVIDPLQLDVYNISDISQITIRLKELKGILTLADQLNQAISCYFDFPGSPVIFSISQSDVYKIDFVIATTRDEIEDASSQIRQSNPPSHNPTRLLHINHQTPIRKPIINPISQSTHHTYSHDDEDAAYADFDGMDFDMIEQVCSQFDTKKEDKENKEEKEGEENEEKVMTKEPQDHVDLAPIQVLQENKEKESEENEEKVMMQVLEEDDDEELPASPATTRDRKSQALYEKLGRLGDEEDADDDEVMEATPTISHNSLFNY